MSRSVWTALRLTAATLLFASATHAQDVPAASEPTPPSEPALTGPSTPTPPGESTLTGPSTPTDAAPVGDRAAPEETRSVEAPLAGTPKVEAAAGSEDTQLSTADLAGLGFSEGEAGASATDMGIKFYGFADFNVRTMLMPNSNPWRGAYQRHTAFFIGNFNLYLSKNLTEKLRMFSEVRFTFLPNGSPISGSPTGEYQRTSAVDPASAQTQLKWAGIEIERVYLEWAYHRALTFRAGVFLTPYGIWNVDHGSPTIVSVERPFVINMELFPERQTGLEVFGSIDASAHNSFGYHLTLSNGMGPVKEYRDLDENKAVGGRLYWSNDAFGQLQLGGSAFYGTDTDAREVPTLQSDGKHVVYKEKISSQSDVLSLAADLRWTYRGLLVQSEVITQQRKFAERGRAGAFNPLVGQYLASTDSLAYGAYGLVGYRFNWFGVMPYMLIQHLDHTSPDSSSLRINALFVGVNIRPIDVFVFKAEYVEARTPEDNILGTKPLRFMQLQLAWAF